MRLLLADLFRISVKALLGLFRGKVKKITLLAEADGIAILGDRNAPP